MDFNLLFAYVAGLSVALWMPSQGATVVQVDTISGIVVAVGSPPSYPLAVTSNLLFVCNGAGFYTSSFHVNGGDFVYFVPASPSNPKVCIGYILDGPSVTG